MQFSRSASRAFMPYPKAPVPHAPGGPLSGLTFAVKDLYDVAGYPTSAGNPLFLAASGVKDRHAAVVEQLLAAGAEFVGKTVTDEFAYSMAGENVHFGAPVNGGAPLRATGGSSSGSASAVSCGLAEFAIGTDTGGSVRCPASQCGLFGLRPTHGRISLEGCHPLAPSFDTVGWFARDIRTFARVADVLLGPEPPLPAEIRILRADDVFERFGAQVSQCLAPAVRRIEEVFGPAVSAELAPHGMEADAEAFRLLQAQEAWQSDGEFIETNQPPLGPGVRERFAFARKIALKDLSSEIRQQRLATAALEKTLGTDGVMVLPTLPGPAVPRGAPESEVNDFRTLSLLSLCHGGLTGLPWLSLPLGRLEGAPVGLSLIGPRGWDRRLIAVAERILG